MLITALKGAVPDPMSLLPAMETCPWRCLWPSSASSSSSSYSSSVSLVLVLWLLGFLGLLLDLHPHELLLQFLVIIILFKSFVFLKSVVVIKVIHPFRPWLGVQCHHCLQSPLDRGWQSLYYCPLECLCRQFATVWGTVIIIRPQSFGPFYVLKDRFFRFDGQAGDSHSACVGWEERPETLPEEVSVSVEGGVVR